ncbi:MAG: hypothetical protein R3E01_05770 [Pirellulaceae bacterium]|nr:hypothetical protein [Planctomycetales bacterium]
MSICRKANTNASSLGILASLLVISLQVLPVFGQDPSVGKAPDDTPLVNTLPDKVSARLLDLAFIGESPIHSDAGHATLRWEPVPASGSYRIVEANDSDAVYYEGSQTQAFLSGLENGEYAFHVLAHDTSQRQIARSQKAIVVQVSHYSLSQALLLFAIGLVVVVIMLGVIVRGTWYPQAVSLERHPIGGGGS